VIAATDDDWGWEREFQSPDWREQWIAGETLHPFPLGTTRSNT